MSRIIQNNAALVWGSSIVLSTVCAVFLALAIRHVLIGEYNEDYQRKKDVATLLQVYVNMAKETQNMAFVRVEQEFRPIGNVFSAPVSYDFCNMVRKGYLSGIPTDPTRSTSVQKSFHSGEPYNCLNEGEAYDSGYQVRYSQDGTITIRALLDNGRPYDVSRRN